MSSCNLTARRPKEEKVVDVKRRKLDVFVKDQTDADKDEPIQVNGKRKISLIVDSDNDEINSHNCQDMDDKNPSQKKAPGNLAARKKIKIESNGKTLSFEEKLKANSNDSHSLSDYFLIILPFWFYMNGTEFHSLFVKFSKQYAVLSNTIQETLLPNKQFGLAEKTLQNLSEKYYGSRHDKEWPGVIRVLQDDRDHLGLTPHENYRLALKALGGCLWYISKCVIDEQIMSMAPFKFYVPPNFKPEDSHKAVAHIANKSWNRHMVLLK